MSLLYKRPNSPFWYVTKTRQSTKTANRKNAEEFARKALTEAWRIDALGEETHTWLALVEAWLDVKSHKKSLVDDMRITADITDWLRRRELADASLSTLTAEQVRLYGAFIKARASAPTANRHLTILRSMLRKASDWGWLVKVPAISLYPEPRKEPRWLTPAEFEKLRDALPEWVADMATIAVQTGMRYSNVAGLRWDWINAAGTVAHVPAESAKGKRTITVPLSIIAKATVSKLRERRIDGQEYVLTSPLHESPIPSVRHWWERACAASGVTCRFHDLRHTWASWHVQAKTPDRIVQEMGGWAGPAMLQRYAHLATEHLTDYADNLNTAASPAPTG